MTLATVAGVFDGYSKEKWKIKQHLMLDKALGFSCWNDMVVAGSNTLFLWQ